MTEELVCVKQRSDEGRIYGHAYGLVAKTPRSHLWKVYSSGHRPMSAALRLRELHFPALHAAA